MWPGSGSTGEFDASASTKTNSATATVIVTCGAGPTRGYRSWSEVLADNAEALFGDEDTFNDLVVNESRLWYEVDWGTVDIAALTPSVIPADPGPQGAGATSGSLDAQLKEYYGQVNAGTKGRLAYSLSLTTDAFRYFGEIKRMRRLLVEPVNY